MSEDPSSGYIASIRDLKSKYSSPRVNIRPGGRNFIRVDSQGVTYIHSIHKRINCWSAFWMLAVKGHLSRSTYDSEIEEKKQQLHNIFK